MRDKVAECIRGISARVWRLKGKKQVVPALGSDSRAKSLLAQSYWFHTLRFYSCRSHGSFLASPALLTPHAFLSHISPIHSLHSSHRICLLQSLDIFAPSAT